MAAQVINSSSKEINISLNQTDIGILYIVQHELLKETDIDFAGVIVKHPLTNECWVRVNTSKGNPLKEIENATSKAIGVAEDLKKLFNSKIKVN